MDSKRAIPFPTVDKPYVHFFAPGRLEQAGALFSQPRVDGIPDRLVRSGGRVAVGDILLPNRFVRFYVMPFGRKAAAAEEAVRRCAVAFPPETKVQNHCYAGLKQFKRLGKQICGRSAHDFIMPVAKLLSEQSKHQLVTG